MRKHRFFKVHTKRNLGLFNRLRIDINTVAVRIGILRIAHMRIDAVVAAEHADDATLCPGGRGLVETALGQYDDVPAVGKLQCGRQAGKAGADDHHGRGLLGKRNGWNSGHETVAGPLARPGIV